VPLLCALLSTRTCLLARVVQHVRDSNSVWHWWVCAVHMRCKLHVHIRHDQLGQWYVVRHNALLASACCAQCQGCQDMNGTWDSSGETWTMGCTTYQCAPSGTITSTPMQHTVVGSCCQWFSGPWGAHMYTHSNKQKHKTQRQV